eukprot:TRINITY_DN1530_c0_g1_i1.p1 TRINITY_DN1530_c0_g1~~TRINITY_DN1530_c0_g1_i1.p1  ORF type:complete len:1288 (-),score=325.60 TRINITY_DN1530_c0_g1_i1:25-3888(-)
MGNKSGKRVISYSEASSRCTPQEKLSLKTTFKVYSVRPSKDDDVLKPRKAHKRRKSKDRSKSSGVSDSQMKKQVLTKHGFKHNVMPIGFPDAISSKMFSCFDAGDNGWITWKDFVVGMVVFLKGTPEEKSRFLYQIYGETDENNGLISRMDMEHILKDDIFLDNDEKSVEQILDDLFKDADPENDYCISSDELYEWVEQNKGLTFLISWLYEDEKQIIEIEEDEQILEDLTVWKCEENIYDLTIEDLEHVYSRFVKEGSTMGYVNLNTAKRILKGFPDLLITRIYNIFASFSIEEVTSQNLILALLLIWGGDQSEKIEFCYDICCVDNSENMLDYRIVYNIFKSIWILAYVDSGVSTKKKKKKKKRQVQSEAGDETHSLVDEFFQMNNLGPDDLVEKEIFFSFFESESALDLSERVMEVSYLYFGVRPKTSKNECKIIQDLYDQNEDRSVGNTYYIIWKRWWDEWCEYSGFEADVQEDAVVPDVIDNNVLLRKGSEISIQKELVEGEDYILLPEAAWNALYSWYRGGPLLPRKMVEYDGNQIMEVYPPELILYERYTVFQQTYNRSNALFSMSSTIEDIINYGRNIFKIPMDRGVRLWIRKKKLPLLLEETEWNILDYGLYDQPEVKLYLEIRMEDGFWPIDKYMEASGAKKPETVKAEPGLVGLMNLGNTCYMNSGLQSLSNTPGLAEYFSSNLYKYELNKRNPLGSGGQIAKEFSKVIKKLWSDPSRRTINTVIPLGFKKALSNVNDQFSGFQQQDAQEMLSCLLDKLHEDLNRVIEKPYFPGVDTDDKSVQEIAEESWDQFYARNQSIIVDIFHGLMKSELECETCSHQSLTFEPFTFLSIPLPVHKKRNMEIRLFTLDGDIPVTYGITLDHDEPILNLKLELEAASNIPAENMAVADVTGHYIFSILSDHKAVNLLDPKNVYMYEIPGNRYNPRIAEENEDVYYYSRIMHRTMVKPKAQLLNASKPQLFGEPFLICSPVGDTTNIEFHEQIWESLKRYVSFPDMPPKVGGYDYDEILEKIPYTIVSVNRNGTRCSKCHWSEHCFGCTIQANDEPFHISKREAIAINWNLNFPNDVREYFSMNKTRETTLDETVAITRAKERAPITIYECLEEFTTRELLEGEDVWYCSNCQEHRSAFKKFDLWFTPRVLILHLKRFDSTPSGWIKLDRLVEFPFFDFDLSPFVANENLQSDPHYDLFACLNHFGGLGRGHYTTYAKNYTEDRWYCFDDRRCFIIDENKNVQSPSAYLLFYVRKDVLEEGFDVENYIEKYIGDHALPSKKCNVM